MWGKFVPCQVKAASCKLAPHGCNESNGRIAKTALPKIDLERYTPPSSIGRGRRTAETNRNSVRTVEFRCVSELRETDTIRPPGWKQQPAGSSGYWVGHSSGCFAVELLSDREPGLCARLPGNHQ